MRSFSALLLIAVAHAWSAPAVKVWDGPGVTLLGAPSRDGRFLSFVEPGTGHLALRTLATGESRVLVKATGRQFAYFSTLAPDSSAVAFAWFNADGFYELRTVDVKSGAVRTLYSNEEAGFVQPCAYSPDGTQILTLFFRKDNISQIALVPAAGGTPRVLRSLNWVYPKRMDFSPDGRFIVYDSFVQDGGPDRTLFVLRVDGQGEHRLLDTPGNLFPQWTPSGIVYVSGNDVALLRVSELGKPIGTPRVLLPGLGRLVPLGVTRDGDYFYGLRTGTVDVAVSSLDGGKPQGVSVRFPGRNSAPAWSRDGTKLAYLSRRGTENFGQEARTVVVRQLSSPDEREVETGLAHLASVRWSWDGQELLVAGTDGQGRGGLFAVSATTGGARLLLRDDGGGTTGVDGHWIAPDAIAYLANGGVRQWSHGKTRELVAGGGFTHLTARDGELAWLAPDGIHWLRQGKHEVLAAPAGLTELAFATDGLLAGNGKELWLMPTDGGAARPVPFSAQRTGRLAVHPDGRRVAYTTGGTESSVWKLKLP